MGIPIRSFRIASSASNQPYEPDCLDCQPSHGVYAMAAVCLQNCITSTSTGGDSEYSPKSKTMIGVDRNSHGFSVGAL